MLVLVGVGYMTCLGCLVGSVLCGFAMRGGFWAWLGVSGFAYLSLGLVDCLCLWVYLWVWWCASVGV